MKVDFIGLGNVVAKLVARLIRNSSDVTIMNTKPKVSTSSSGIDKVLNRKMEIFRWL